MIVNVAIVTYNRIGLLKKCIESIRSQSYRVNRIIVFDNNSNDGTEIYLDKLASSGEILYVKSHTNKGASYGFHYSIAIASLNCDWVWIMDDDVIPETSALERIIDKLRLLSHEIGFFCSNVKSPEGFPMNVPIVSGNNHENGYSRALTRLDKSLVEVDIATFVSLLVNCKAINKIGLPYKDFFIWGDDTEYTRRITKFFGPGYIVGDSNVIHYRSGSSSLNIGTEIDVYRIFLYRYLIRNKLVYMRYYSKSLIKFIYILLRYILSGLNYLLKFNRVDFKRFLTILSGVYGFIIGNYNKKKFINRFDDKPSLYEIESIFTLSDSLVDENI